MSDIILVNKSECESMIDFIECTFFTTIREDESIDNIEWAINILNMLRKFKESYARLEAAEKENPTVEGAN